MDTINIFYWTLVIAVSIFISKIWKITIERKYPKRSTQIWIIRWVLFALVLFSFLTDSTYCFGFYLISLCLICNMLIYNPIVMRNLKSYERIKENNNKYKQKRNK